MPPALRSASAPGSEAFRLPRTIEPETYRIEIEPDVASATFSGTVSIDVQVKEAVDEIVLNAAELAVSDVEVRTSDGRTISCTVTFDDDLERVIFRPAATVPPLPRRARPQCRLRDRAHRRP
jgi:aminopeptidase N